LIKINPPSIFNKKKYTLGVSFNFLKEKNQKTDDL